MLTRTKPYFHILVILVFLPLIWCCSAKETAQTADPFFDEWRKKASISLPTGVPEKKTAINVAEPAQPETRQLPKTSLLSSSRSGKVDKTDLPKNKISITYVDTELATVLRSLGRMAGQNILINSSVQGIVNIYIIDTPWNDVFLSLIDSYGLLVSREDNLLRVMSLEDLKIQVEREALLLEQERVSPLITKIIPIEFSDPVLIAESIKVLLTKDKKGAPRGSVSVDTHSRSLVIQDVQENLAILLHHIGQLDQPTPQILIEAHIVETTKDTARELGAQWGWMMIDQISGDRGIGIHPGGVNGVENTTTGIIEYEAGVDGNNRGGIGGQGFGIDLPANAIGSVNPFSLGFMHFTQKGNLLDIQLSALQKKGKVNVLSRPSIATLDNIEAIIESGTEVPFQTIDQYGNIKVEYKDAVLRLKVTPHVISNHLIKLDIVAKKDEVDLTRTVLGNPFIIKKLATTKLIVENGSTVVIAGLSKDRKTEGNIGIPYLKDIPILGYLFRNDSRSNQFEDLLIFITPTILTNSNEVVSLASEENSKTK